MVDIYNIPVYYISFVPVPDLVSNLRERGFKKIHYFKAIDGRKFTPDELFKKNLLTIRSYTDLKLAREQHSGIPSLGAIGCTMSHNALWKLCVDKKLPYIIISESDVYLWKISPQTEQKIQKILEKPNSVFNSALVREEGTVTYFWNIQFYIASNGACKQLIKNAFPIDVQTDYYLAHMNTIKKIHLEGFKVSNAISHPSSIQTSCIKCFMPKAVWIYGIIVAIFLFVIIILFIVFKNWRTCNRNLEACKNTPTIRGI